MKNHAKHHKSLWRWKPQKHPICHSCSLSLQTFMHSFYSKEKNSAKLQFVFCSALSPQEWPWHLPHPVFHISVTLRPALCALLHVFSIYSLPVHSCRSESPWFQHRSADETIIRVSCLMRSEKFVRPKITNSLVVGPRFSLSRYSRGSSNVRNPIFSDIPNSLTILFAIDVARLKSLLAPTAEKNVINQLPSLSLSAFVR